jgi:hypothetical protein
MDLRLVSRTSLTPASSAKATALARLWARCRAASASVALPVTFVHFVFEPSNDLSSWCPTRYAASTPLTTTVFGFTLPFADIAAGYRFLSETHPSQGFFVGDPCLSAR